MAEGPTVRDKALIDALEATPGVSFDGTLWRVVRSDRDVLSCSSYGGRWDDGRFDVLYTSQEANGALAERYFHLARGQPVIPSRVSYTLFEVHAALANALRLVDLSALANFGVETARFGSLSYQDRAQEYPSTQQFAEAVHFIGFDGLIVPNARWACLYVVLFCDRVPPEALEVARDHGMVDWAAWRQNSLGT